MKTEQVVFFDGVCGLCNNFVDFLLKVDRRQKLTFSSLQGETSAKLLDSKMASQLMSVVFLQRGRLYFKSEAVIRILAEVGGIWSCAKVFFLLPEGVRDKLYMLVAQRRYQLFGKKESCRLPTPQERSRFAP